jgi:DNA polymerase III subunit epsilon
MYLFFDTETTGIPRNYKAPVTDLANWPRVVQLAFLLADAGGATLAASEFIIRPDGFVIPADAARVHGITTERALAEGVPLAAALDGFTSSLQSATTLVAHNISFDSNILGAEFLRAKRPNPLPKLKQICTMQSTTDFCAIPGPFGFKWPKLGQLHARLFREELKDAHAALADVQACCRCFFELRELGVIR